MSTPSQTLSLSHAESVQRTFMNRVYSWMTLGLLVTAIVSMLAARSQTLTHLLFAQPFVLLALVLAELGIVLALVAGMNKLSVAAANTLFIVYAALTGLTLSSIFLVYDLGTIATAFFVTAGTFAVMSLYGYATKRDLTGLGGLALMGLFGIIIASVVNIFLHNAGLDLVLSYLGVFIFMGLIAFDTQKLKKYAASITEDDQSAHKVAIMGALALYLDLINIFLFLLRIFGGRD